jgi:hypothetical protein
MKGKLLMEFESGNGISADVDVYKGRVNEFEVAVKYSELKNQIHPHTPHILYLQLPSKMNFSDFVYTREEAPYK